MFRLASVAVLATSVDALSIRHLLQRVSPDLEVNIQLAGADGGIMDLSLNTDPGYFSEWQRRLGMTPSTDTIDASSAALIVVDMQNDFVGEFKYTPEQIAAGESPCYRALGNSSQACFGVRQGNEVAEVVARMLGQHTFQTVVASMDDHSEHHCSFDAVAGGTEVSANCIGEFDVDRCDASQFHKCKGTMFENRRTAGTVTGPFPPHCTRGTVGAELYAPVYEALLQYGGEKHVAVKGLDLSTDSFGVLPYTQQSWEFYARAGLMSGPDPSPAVMRRSMLTFEKHMRTSTGAATYTTPFDAYYQPPPFSSDGDSGTLRKTTAQQLVAGAAEAELILVSGLAGDWCVLDTALNAAALWPEKSVYVVLDATRPSYLPRQFAGDYLKTNHDNQLYDGGVWLHDPSDVAAVMRAAGVQVITSDQIS